MLLTCLSLLYETWSIWGLILSREEGNGNVDVHLSVCGYIGVVMFLNVHTSFLWDGVVMMIVI